MPKNNSQFLTVSYGIRKPTSRKREVLEIASELYTQSAQSLLDWCRENLETLREQGFVEVTNKKTGATTKLYKADSIRALLPSMASLNLPLASAVNEALIRDIASAIASYLALSVADPRTQFPTAKRERIITDQDYVDILQQFSVLGDDIDEENRLSDILTSKSRTINRPISYCRSRDFSLLSDPNEPHELYAWLPLLPASNTIIEPYYFDGNMVDIATGVQFKRRSNVGIIVKLYIPDERRKHWYNRQFLTPILNGKASIKTANLIHETTGWRLNVSICYETMERYEPRTYIGVSVGAMEHISYAVVGLDGKVLREHVDEVGIHSLMTNTRRSVRRRQYRGQYINAAHYRKQSQYEILHHIADKMIEIAMRHKSMLVLQDFSDNPGTNAKIKPTGKPSRLLAPWRKFEFIVGYKANMAGVPVRTGMWAAFAGRFCPKCGGRCETDKTVHPWVVECESCLMRKERGVVASINLARRMNYRKDEWVKRGDYPAFHRAIAAGVISQVEPVS